VYCTTTMCGKITGLHYVEFDRMKLYERCSVVYNFNLFQIEMCGDVVWCSYINKNITSNTISIFIKFWFEKNTTFWCQMTKLKYLFCFEIWIYTGTNIRISNFNWCNSIFQLHQFEIEWCVHTSIQFNLKLSIIYWIYVSISTEVFEMCLLNVWNTCLCFESSTPQLNLYV